MGLNLSNFLISKSKNKRMKEFQDLDHVDGLSISSVSANLYKSLCVCIWVAYDVYNRFPSGSNKKSLGGARYATTPIYAYREYNKNSTFPNLC